MKQVTSKLLIVSALIIVLCELIGKISIPVGKVNIILFPMLYAVAIGLIITPDLLGKKIKALQKVLGNKEVKLAGEFVGMALLILGVKYGTLAGPNFQKIIEAGPAFLAQEFGHILSPLIALPLALFLGMKREAVGATSSISREPSLGVIGEKYGIDSPEGSGVLGTYLIGTVLGTIVFGILGSVSIHTGIHPYALGMACGVGSGSMMTAAVAALAETVPFEMRDTVVAYAATSNMLSGITGVNFLIFITLPLTNKLYAILEPKLGRRGVKSNASN
ncbi:DUF3100 domain-containing protein [Cetobacterium sp. 2A]|uniref:DUF3100 domain-containing protein n=1 Tax=Cetobacterium sp. 2A TaxID=2754723 RepID=UPI00163BEB83|nr:DUF3100 domain-containing protein [Cetobacterium sp. 2A]MBC2857158.1 DUF3100 domain-containing protein [Cetobacterium sp. 2A]